MYVEQKPPAELARWIECAWSLEVTTPQRAHAVRPDGCMDILYSPSAGLEVVGTMTREQRFDLGAGDLRVGLRFRPGMARSFLRLDAEELRDRVVPLGAIAGKLARELRPKLEAARSAAECRSTLNAAIHGPVDPPDPVLLAIEAMARVHGEIDIDWAARHAGLSARQFRRRCVEESGLGPKHLARILRFRRACELAARGESWLRVAAEAGYFDQAHLIRDFHEFAGGSPVSVFSKTEKGNAG
jgi:AraC-like DNA-binding protein